MNNARKHAGLKQVESASEVLKKDEQPVESTKEKENMAAAMLILQESEQKILLKPADVEPEPKRAKKLLKRKA